MTTTVAPSPLLAHFSTSLSNNHKPHIKIPIPLFSHQTTLGTLPEFLFIAWMKVWTIAGDKRFLFPNLLCFSQYSPLLHWELGKVNQRFFEYYEGCEERGCALSLTWKLCPCQCQTVFWSAEWQAQRDGQWNSCSVAWKNKEIKQSSMFLVSLFSLRNFAWKTYCTSSGLWTRTASSGPAFTLILVVEERDDHSFTLVFIFASTDADDSPSTDPPLWPTLQEARG